MVGIRGTHKTPSIYATFWPTIELLVVYRPTYHPESNVDNMVKGSCMCGDWTYEYDGEPAVIVSRSVPVDECNTLITICLGCMPLWDSPFDTVFRYLLTQLIWDRHPVPEECRHEWQH